MTNALKYTLYIGSGLLLGLGAYFTITGVMASKEDKDKKAKEEADKAAAEAIKQGNATAPTVNTGTSTTTSPTPVNTQPAITGSVATAVNKYADSKLVGKPVYATGNWTVFNTAGKVYTKTTKGQLLGTFAYSKIKLSGGKNIYIKTTDSQNPYVYIGDTLVTFTA